MCFCGGRFHGLTQEQHLKMSRFAEEVAATTLGEGNPCQHDPGMNDTAEGCSKK